MLFVSYGTTDLPLRGVVFTTPGVRNFLEGTMKIDMLVKIEGFAVQGIHGLTNSIHTHAFY